MGAESFLWPRRKSRIWVVSHRQERLITAITTGMAAVTAYKALDVVAQALEAKRSLASELLKFYFPRAMDGYYYKLHNVTHFYATAIRSASFYSSAPAILKSPSLGPHNWYLPGNRLGEWSCGANGTIPYC